MDARWEYDDVIIPLDLRVPAKGAYVRHAAALADPLIRAELQRRAQDGWQADESAAFESLFYRGRITSKLVNLGLTLHVTAAHLCLKRLIEPVNH
jgi:hypothetical protein